MAKGIYVGVETKPQALSNLPVGSLVKDPNSTFLGATVIWKIADVNHEGYPSNSVTLITERSIALRSFDAAESGKNTGYNKYSVSNIRQWLNSDAEAGQWYSAQHSTDAPPSSANVWSSVNAYDTKAGFLNNFSDNFKNALLETTLTVALNTNTDGGGSETVIDKIFLASTTEVGLANENSIVEGSILPIFSDNASRCVSVTAKGLADSEYSNDPTENANWHWWLRTPNSTANKQVHTVYSNGTVSNSGAYDSSCGVRPLCNISSSTLVSPTTDADGCYTLFDENKGVAHKVTKAYVGVSNVARKVKKGYIGVGGVARPFFSSEKELVYYGTATALSVARRYLAATSVGGYALFGGGYNDSVSTTVDAYSNSLVRSIPTKFTYSRQKLAATTVGNYALFAGGVSGSSYNEKVEMYDTNLTHSTSTSLSAGRYDLAATTVGNYALFGGGRTSSNKKTVDAIGANLATSTPSAFPSTAYQLAATSVGNYALFGGGLGLTQVVAYDTNLTQSTPTALTAKRYNHAATSVGNYALFGGGDGYLSTVETYNENLTRGTATSFEKGRDFLAATNVGGFALFAGGRVSGGSASNIVDIYDINLVRSTMYLTTGRMNLAATNVGDYALFGGGLDGNNYHNEVAVFQAV